MNTTVPGRWRRQRKRLQQGRTISAWLLLLFMAGMPASILAQGDVVARPADGGPVVLRVDFDESPLGDYTTAAFHADWPDAEWVSGLGTGRAEIVDGASAYSGRSLRLKYPAGTYGSRNQAIQARIDLPRSFEELHVSYRVRFEDGFDFVKGGKLPGLMGGAGNVGGNRPSGRDGWSGRMMWRRGGDAVQYVYHPDQPGIYGEDFRWERRFEPGRWHTVEHRFVMNDPRMHDGTLQAWFDGQEALYVDDLRFRDVDSFAIDQFYISTFFGGDDSTWASVEDEYILFDDIIISTARIHLPPATVVSIPDLRLGLRASLDLDLSRAFVDPYGRALSHGVSSSAPAVVTGRVAGARLTLTAVGVGTAAIRVTATEPGGLSATQMFTVTVVPTATAPFSDDPIVPRLTPVKAVHFTELRARIDALRSATGLARFSWTDPALRARETRVRRVHLLELRAALAEAYGAAGRAPPRWTDASPASGSTPIRALHVTELRAAVLALEFRAGGETKLDVSRPTEPVPNRPERSSPPPAQ